jgi:hypothetical protein
MNNLLAEKPVEKLVVGDIANIAAKYHVNLFKKYPDKLLEFYKVYLKYCLKDKNLSDNGVSALENLKFVLNIKDEESKNIFDEVTKEVYKKEVAKVIADGVLDSDEEKRLLTLEANLHISHDLAMQLYGEETNALYSKAVAKAVADEKLSPEEEKEIEALAQNLHIKVSHDEGTSALLAKYRLFWQIDNGMLPTIDVSINLQKGEICHFNVTEIDWLEQRAVTRRVNYSGLSYRVSICKGLSWRAGSIAPQPLSEDVWKIIDSGDLYLTNKRMIFMGGKGNKTLTFKKILDFSIHTNGVDIQKDTGKSPFLQFFDNTDIFGMILGKLVMEEPPKVAPENKIKRKVKTPEEKEKERIERIKGQNEMTKMLRKEAIETASDMGISSGKIKWVLDSNHEQGCLCEDYSKGIVNGKQVGSADGVFDIKNLPPIPNCQCNARCYCSFTPILKPMEDIVAEFKARWPKE